MLAFPAEIPVTTPLALIAAIAGLLLLQVPPAASESTVVEPTQTCVNPTIGDGKGFTVITRVMMHPVEIR